MSEESELPRFERLGTVLSRLGVSRSTLYERIAAGKFPKPVQLGSTHRVGWLQSETTAAILQMVSESRGTTYNKAGDPRGPVSSVAV